MACESTVVLSKDTNLPQVINQIKKFTISGSSNPEIQNIAYKCSLSADPVQCAFDEVYNRVVYQPDPDRRQIIKAVHCSLADGYGNCVDYSILLGAILINLNVPFSFKVVSFTQPDGYDHIYIKTDSGIVLDPVLGQRQDGTDTRENRPKKGRYNTESNFKYQKTYPMTSLEVLQGTNKSFSRTLASRVNGYQLNDNMYSRVAQSRQMQGSTELYTNVPGVPITSSGGIVATLLPDSANTSGYLAIEAPGSYGQASNAKGKEIFWDGNTLYSNSSPGGYIYNNGTGWQVANALEYGAARTKALAKVAAAQVTASTGVSTPVLIGGLALVGGGIWYFFFRKKKNKK